jgi:omega-6 fatty acid desaturase (delta-12 desaturase)
MAAPPLPALRAAQRSLVFMPAYAADDSLAMRGLVLSFATYFAALFLVPGPASSPVSLAALGFYLLHAAVTTRLFMPFHDAGHLSFFSTVKDNDRLGWLLQLFTFTDFAAWRAGHNRHHAVQGNSSLLDEASTIQYTVDEYRMSSLLFRLAYRIVRDPLVLPLVFGPFFWGLVMPLVPAHSLLCRISIPFHALLFAMFAALRDYALGASLHAAGDYVWAGFVTALFSVWTFGAVAVNAFHLQHGINSGYRAPEERFDVADEAMRGSTMVEIPFPLSYCTWNIQFHHIHHLTTRVPSYKLDRCHAAGTRANLWCEVVTLPLISAKALSSLFNVLWSDKANAYVPFWPYHLITGALEGNHNWAALSSAKEDGVVPANAEAALRDREAIAVNEQLPTPQ